MLAFTGTCICIFEITLYFTYTCKFTLARAFLDFSQIFIINIDIHICRSISYNSLSFNQQWVIDIKVDPRNKQMLALTYDGIYVVSFIVSTCIRYICWCWCVYKKVISAYVPFTHICSYLVNEWIKVMHLIYIDLFYRNYLQSMKQTHLLQNRHEGSLRW